jgi:hypothetical protein
LRDGLTPLAGEGTHLILAIRYFQLSKSIPFADSGLQDFHGAPGCGEFNVPGTIGIRLDSYDPGAQGRENRGHRAHIGADVKNKRALR